MNLLLAKWSWKRSAAILIINIKFAQNKNTVGAACYCRLLRSNKLLDIIPLFLIANSGLSITTTFE